MHTAACGISWSDSFSAKPKSVDTEPFEEEAKLLAGITDLGENSFALDEEWYLNLGHFHLHVLVSLSPNLL